MGLAITHIFMKLLDMSFMGKKDLTLYGLGHLVMEHSHNGVVMNKMRT